MGSSLLLRRSFHLASVLAALTCPVPFSPGGDAPARGPNGQVNGRPATAPGKGDRNPVNTVDKNVVTEWVVAEGKRKNVKWVAKLGTKTYGGPILGGGKLFVGTNNGSPRDPQVTGDKGIVMGFRASEGQFLGQLVHDELPDEVVKEARGEGLPATPTVDGNRLYYVNNRCELVCADTDGFGNGKKPNDAIAWRLDMMKELNVFPHKLPNGSPLVVGDLVFVTTGNGVDPDTNQVRSPQAPSFIAVNKKTGKVVWQDNSPGDQIMLGQWSHPVYAEVNGKGQVIFGGGDGWLRAFEPATGKPIWKFDCNPKSAKAGARGGRNYLVAAPVVHDNKVYVGVGQEPSLGVGVGHLWCVDLTKSGNISPVNDNFDPTAALNKNAGLVWHYGGKTDAKTEETTGRDSFFGRTVSQCAVQDGLVYAAELAGYLHCLDARTGKKYWDHDLKSAVWGSPYVVDGKVYLGTEDGDVWIFGHGKEKKEVGKVEMDDGPIYSTPLVADGVLYVMTMQHLFAIAKK
jgi:outer membrane protein assembly factor BamB